MQTHICVSQKLPLAVNYHLVNEELHLPASPRIQVYALHINVMYLHQDVQSPHAFSSQSSIASIHIEM